MGHPQKIKAVGISKVSPIGSSIGNFLLTRRTRIPYPRAGVVETATAADDIPTNQVMKTREAIPLDDGDRDAGVATGDGISPVTVSKSWAIGSGNTSRDTAETIIWAWRYLAVMYYDDQRALEVETIEAAVYHSSIHIRGLVCLRRVCSVLEGLGGERRSMRSLTRLSERYSGSRMLTRMELVWPYF